MEHQIVNKPGSHDKRSRSPRLEKGGAFFVPVNVQCKNKNFFHSAENLRVQRMCHDCKQEAQIQRSENNHTPVQAPSIVNSAIHSSGSKLDTATRSFMEGKFGYDFSNVKIHDST